MTWKSAGVFRAWMRSASVPRTTTPLRSCRCFHLATSCNHTDSTTRFGAMMSGLQTSNHSKSRVRRAVRVTTVLPRPISSSTPALGLSRMCWYAVF